MARLITTKSVRMKTPRRTFLSVLGALLIGDCLRPFAAAADTSEPVLLTIHGANGTQAFRRADLEALPQQTFSTSTVWTSGVHDYSGPALSDVLAAAGLGAMALRMQAANDYFVMLEPEMIEADAPIVVTRINGQPFGLRDRGPLWLMYPYDASPRYRSETIFAASIWQLTDIFTDAVR